MTRQIKLLGVLFCLLLGFSIGAFPDSASSFGFLSQNGGTPQGGATTLNCDNTTTTCSNSGGVVTVSAISGSAGINQLTGDVTAGPGSGKQTATVVGVNSAAVPASANVVGTNSSKQIVAALAANIVNLFSSCSGTQYLGADGNCHNASSGGAFYQTLTAPTSGSFTQLNYNTGTNVVTTQVNNSSPVTSITLRQHDPSGTNNTAAFAKNKIAATYTLTEGFTFVGTNQALCGIWLSDGGSPPNNITYAYQASAGLRASFWTNFTSFSSDISGPESNYPTNGVIWFQVQETASARIYRESSDGITWSQNQTESNTAHFTTSQYGFFCQSRAANTNGPDAQGTLYSFTETTP